MRLNYSFRFIILYGALAASSAIVSRASEYSDHGCTNATLRGDYGFTARGTTLSALGLPPSLTGAFVSSGSAHFDGMGHFTLTATSSFSGVIQGPATVTGTYAVNSDCSCTSQASNGVSFRAVIVNDARELLILQTTPGAVITGIAEKRGGAQDVNESFGENRKACSAASFAGAYGFLAGGLPERLHFPEPRSVL